MKKPIRCSYCKSLAVVWMKYKERSISPRFGQQITTLYTSACSEHEGCKHWNGNLAIHKDAKIVRAS